MPAWDWPGSEVDVGVADVDVESFVEYVVALLKPSHMFPRSLCLSFVSSRDSLFTLQL